MNTTLLLTGVVYLLGLALLISAYLLRDLRAELAKLRAESERLYRVRATLDRLRPSWRDTSSTEDWAIELMALSLVTNTDNLINELERVVPPWRSSVLHHFRRAALGEETFCAVKAELERAAADLREPDDEKDQA